MDSLLVPFVSELIGTFVLVSVVLMSGQPFAIGLALAVAILLVGKSSLGAFNPAVAVGLYADKRLTGQELGTYVLAQILGAFGAYAWFKYATNNNLLTV